MASASVSKREMGSAEDAESQIVLPGLLHSIDNVVRNTVQIR